MRRGLLLAGSVVLAGFAAWLTGQAVGISHQARAYCYADTRNVPFETVGLVLGCAPQRPDGRVNPYFQHRVKAAADLFKSGKVKYLLVSGDHGRREYDEPTAMRTALIKAGVPAANITLDYAGFRTLDSVVRAKEVFGLSSFVVVSQRFQNERAIFIARANGIQAIGYDAADVAGLGGAKIRAREVLARMRAVV